MPNTKPKYRDVSSSFAAHPGNDDLSVVTDERAVMQSIRTLVMTDLYGRLFAGKTKAGGARELLFSIVTPMVIEQLETRIKTTIEDYEDRAILEDVEVSQPDPESLYVKIAFATTNDTSNGFEFGFYLKRTL